MEQLVTSMKQKQHKITKCINKWLWHNSTVCGFILEVRGCSFFGGVGGSSLLTTVFFFKLNACKVLYFWPLWHFSPSAHQPESFSLIAWLAKSNRSVAIYWDRKLLQSMNELNTILKQKLNYWLLIEITLLMSQFYILTILMTYLDPLKIRRYCKVIKIYTFLFI